MPEYRKQEFKVGDRVQMLKGFPVGTKKIYNMKGTVRKYLSGDVGVECGTKTLADTILTVVRQKN